MLVTSILEMITVAWNVGLFYYAGATTPTAQISDFVQKFDGVIITTNNEGSSYNLNTLVSRINDFWNTQSGFQIIVEIPNPSGARTYSYMKDRLDEIESAVSAKVSGYYLVPEGAPSMWNNQASDSTYCKDNVRDIVSDIKDLDKYAVWIPVEPQMNFNYMDLCESHIDFTNIAPQPHYYQVGNSTPTDALRPSGMTYNDLKTFMANCMSRGWGVEFECDKAIASGTTENCGCGSGVPCVKRAANYYCAADAEGPFSYIYHYMSTEIGAYNVVKAYHTITPCPAAGYTTC